MLVEKLIQELQKLPPHYQIYAVNKNQIFVRVVRKEEHKEKFSTEDKI